MKRPICIFLAFVTLISLGLMATLPASDVLAATNLLTISTSEGGSVISPSVGVSSYTTGTVVNLLAYANTGYHFVGWSGDTSTIANLTSSSTTITVNGDYSVTATFALNLCLVTATAGINGSISPYGATSVYHGSDSAFTFTPNTGYRVADVLVDGVSAGALTNYTFTNVTTDHTISVSFILDTYTITASAGANGSISPLGPAVVVYNNSQAYTIAADPGYHIADVLVDGSSVGTVTRYTFTKVNASHSISVSFDVNTFNISADAGANGAISPHGATAGYGSSQTFSIIPGPGYHVADVLVDGTSVGALVSYNFSNVTTGHTISAGFALNTYTITPTTGANGTISPADVRSVTYGGNQTFNISPSAGYHVVDVLVDGTSVGNVTSYTFTSIAVNHTIAGTFGIDTYTITPAAGSHGAISPSDVITVNYGATLTFTFSPNTGYRISNILVDGSSVGAADSYTFTNVTANHTIAVTFAFGWQYYSILGIIAVIIFLLGMWVGGKIKT